MVGREMRVPDLFEHPAGGAKLAHGGFDVSGQQLDGRAVDGPDLPG